MERKCGNCALKALKGGMCPIFNANMENENGCPRFTSEFAICDICGNIILNNSYLQEEDGTIHLFCEECAIGHPCRTCKEISDCKFQTDKSCQEPPFIMAQQRQGNVVMQQQVTNPKRVQATCANGCKCYNSEHGCMREYGCGCENLKINWRK